MKMMISFLGYLVKVCILLGLLAPSSPETAAAEEWGQYCRKGQYITTCENGSMCCAPCPENHYMAEDIHVKSECTPCASAEELIPNEIVVRNCTPEANTIFQCAENYFRDWNYECRQCSKCYLKTRPFLGVPCTPYRDTVCCGQPGMRVEGYTAQCVSDEIIEPSSGFPHVDCEEGIARDNGCLAGEYFVSACPRNDSLLLCKKCKKGTFISLWLHRKTTCSLCSQPATADSHVVSLCNGTQDNVYSVGSDSASIMLVVIAVITFFVFVAIVVAVLLLTFRQRSHTTRQWYRGGRNHLVRPYGKSLLPTKLPSASDSDSDS